MLEKPETLHRPVRFLAPGPFLGLCRLLRLEWQWYD